MEWHLDDQSEIDRVLSIFDIMLLASGCLIPLSTFLLKPFVLDVTGSLMLMAVLSLVQLVAVSFSNLVAMYTVAAIAVFNRFMFFILAPLMLSEMFGKRLGPDAFLSAAQFLSSFANLLSYLWTFICVSPLNGNFLFGFGLLNSCGVLICCTLSYKFRIWRKMSNLH